MHDVDTCIESSITISSALCFLLFDGDIATAMDALKIQQVVSVPLKFCVLL